MTLMERLVPDDLWDIFQRIVPEKPVRSQGGGRQRYGDREMLAAIVFVATTGCPWRRLPPVFGASGATVHRRFTEWRRAQVWNRMCDIVLYEADRLDDPQWSKAVAIAVSTRALAQAELD